MVKTWAHLKLKNITSANETLRGTFEYLSNDEFGHFLIQTPESAVLNTWIELVIFIYFNTVKKELLNFAIITKIARFFLGLKLPSTTRKISVLREFIKISIESIPECSCAQLDGFFDPLSFSKLPRVNAESSDWLKCVRLYLIDYEILITKQSPFPAADLSVIQNYRNDSISECYDFWLMIELDCVDDDLNTLVQRRYNLIETFYRGTKHTFHSLKLLRFISHLYLSIHTLVENIGSSERQEAESCIDSYLFLWEKAYVKQADNAAKDLRNVASEHVHYDTEDSKNTNISVIQGESMACLVGVLITGMRLKLISFNGDVKKVT